MATTDRQRLKAAMSEAGAADRRLRNLVRELFPVGARVYWRHGDAVRSGLVKNTSGHTFDMLRFSVESESERTYWIYAGRILSFFGL